MIPMPMSDEARLPRHTPRPLSPLEREIVRLAEQGLSVREIAYYLSIDTRLVRGRLREILGPPRVGPTPRRRMRSAREHLAVE